MSGHSKWSTIKRKKGALDAKRGKVFTKCAKEIIVAARLGGSDPDANPRLRNAILAARAVNMPRDNIDRAIKKGAGELEGVNYEEIAYEGYGPGGVAIFIEAMTDNRNRTTSEVRHHLEKAGGSLGAPGCVAYNFEKRGQIVLDRSAIEEDPLMELALDAGAEDISEEGDQWVVTTSFEDFARCQEALEQAGLKPTSAEMAMIPKSTVPVSGSEVKKVLTLMEKLDDLDDVQHVWANFDIPDAELEQAS